MIGRAVNSKSECSTDMETKSERKPHKAERLAALTCVIVLGSVVAIPILAAYVEARASRELVVSLRVIDWEGVGAIMTAVAAVIALWIGTRTMSADLRRERKEDRETFLRACRYAPMFDSELAAVVRTSAILFEELAPSEVALRPEAAVDAINRFNANSATPMMDRMIDKLDVFPVEVGGTLGAVVGAVAKYKSRAEIKMRQIELMEESKRGWFFNAIRSEAGATARAAYIAIAQMRSHVKSVCEPMAPLPELPKELRELMPSASES